MEVTKKKEYNCCNRPVKFGTCCCGDCYTEGYCGKICWILCCCCTCEIESDVSPKKNTISTNNTPITMTP